jgi:hypothetical protein
LSRNHDCRLHSVSRQNPSTSGCVLSIPFLLLPMFAFPPTLVRLLHRSSSLQPNTRVFLAIPSFKSFKSFRPPTRPQRSLRPQARLMATMVDPQQFLRTSGATDSVWVHTEPYSNRPQFSKLSKDIETDVCIVGSGISGISIAYELVNQGVNVVLIEARDILSGTSSALRYAALR